MPSLHLHPGIDLDSSSFSSQRQTGLPILLSTSPWQTYPAFLGEVGGSRIFLPYYSSFPSQPRHCLPGWISFLSPDCRLSAGQTLNCISFNSTRCCDRDFISAFLLSPVKRSLFPLRLIPAAYCSHHEDLRPPTQLSGIARSCGTNTDNLLPVVAGTRRILLGSRQPHTTSTCQRTDPTTTDM